MKEDTTMKKTQEMILEQYKRLLKRAFPRLIFYRDNTWNWYKVYNEDPYTNKTFIKIFNAYKSVSNKDRRTQL